MHVASINSNRQLVCSAPRFLLRPFGLDPRRVPCFGLASSEAPEANRFAYELLGMAGKRGRKREVY